PPMRRQIKENPAPGRRSTVPARGRYQEARGPSARGEQMWNKRARQAPRGFTLVEIMIVVLIIGMLMTIAMPQFQRARTGALARACQHNLKHIVGAKERWAMDNNRG